MNIKDVLSFFLLPGLSNVLLHYWLAQAWILGETTRSDDSTAWLWYWGLLAGAITCVVLAGLLSSRRPWLVGLLCVAQVIYFVCRSLLTMERGLLELAVVLVLTAITLAYVGAWLARFLPESSTR